MRKNLLEAIYLGDYLPAEKVSGGEEYEEYHEAAAEPRRCMSSLRRG